MKTYPEVSTDDIPGQRLRGVLIAPNGARVRIEADNVTIRTKVTQRADVEIAPFVTLFGETVIDEVHLIMLKDDDGTAFTIRSVEPLPKPVIDTTLEDVMETVQNFASLLGRSEMSAQIAARASVESTVEDYVRTRMLEEEYKKKQQERA